MIVEIINNMDKTMDAYSLVSYHFHEINRLQSFMLGSTTFGLLLGEKGIGKSLFVRNLTIHLLEEQLQGNLNIHHYIVEESKDNLQAHLPESASKSIKLQPEFHKLVCSNKSHLVILDQAENLSQDQIQLILKYTWKRVRVLLISNRSLPEFFDPYVDSQVTWLSGVPYYQRSEFINGINKSLKAKGQKLLSQDSALKKLEDCRGHRGLLFENKSYDEYLISLGLTGKSEDILANVSESTDQLFDNCLLRDPENPESLCGTLRPIGSKKWSGNSDIAEKWARRNFQSMEKEEEALAKAYDCWQLGLVFSEVFNNLQNSLGKEYLTFTDSIISLASGKDLHIELNPKIPEIYHLRHSWIKVIYQQDKGAIQEIGDKILFEEHSFTNDYFLQLQLLRIEVLIQRRRYTQAEEQLAELVAKTLDGDGGLQCHLLCWEMMLAFFQNRNAHCLMLCDYLTAFAKDVSE